MNNVAATAYYMFSLPEEDLQYALRHCDSHEKLPHNKTENCILLILNFFAMNNHNSFHDTSSFFLSPRVNLLPQN